MGDPATAKCACTACGVHIEFPAELAGSTVCCPQCQESTQLTAGLAENTVELDVPTIVRAFGARVPETRVSLPYRAGLLVVSAAMVLLPVIYVALIALCGFGVWMWATRCYGILTLRGGGIYVYSAQLLFYVAPLVAGLAVILFMIKPLFARRARHAQPLALNPGAEPLLYTFIHEISKAVGAPPPSRIDLNCELNAAASFRRGWKSMWGQDLVLTIGLPLVAGLDTRQFAGVIAHEFGHFTQGFGMRLTYVIRSVNAWFARVVYERDAWDESLEEWAAECESWRGAVVVGTVRLAVWISRSILKVLMYTGHGIGCFALKQMEYDADSYEIKLVGSQCFEESMRRFHVLGCLLDRTYKDLRPGWNTARELPEDFTAFLLRHDRQLTPEKRTYLEDTLGLEKSGLFDSHPSAGDRIRKARQAAEPGVFDLVAPAPMLFSSFSVVTRQVTALHYTDDLGIPAPLIKLVPVTDRPAKVAEPAPIEEPERHSYTGGLRLKGRSHRMDD